MKFKNSKQYWNDRYNSNGNSGAGSYGNLAKFKSEILNNFVIENNIESVIEFGCGDGNQLSLANYPSYVGYDISTKSISICKEIFKDDRTKNFYHIDEYNNQMYELSLSLDVLYHLIEDDTYNNYIQNLFTSSKKFVIIYSSNDETITSKSSHVRHRKFVNDIPSNFECIKIIKNLYPYNSDYEKTTSFSDFYIFRKT